MYCPGSTVHPTFSLWKDTQFPSDLWSSVHVYWAEMSCIPNHKALSFSYVLTDSQGLFATSGPPQQVGYLWICFRPFTSSGPLFGVCKTCRHSYITLRLLGSGPSLRVDTPGNGALDMSCHQLPQPVWRLYFIHPGEEGSKAPWFLVQGLLNSEHSSSPPVVKLGVPDALRAPLLEAMNLH